MSLSGAEYGGEHADGGVGVREGLEIGQVAIGLPSPCGVEGDTGVYLIRDGFPLGIGRVKCCVVAEGASTGSERPVPVRTGEAPVQGEALKTHPVPFGVTIWFEQHDWPYL